MKKQKKDFDPECFGTIDKETKEMCNHCSYSDECETYKQPLADKISLAEEKGKVNYLHQQADLRSTAMGKFLGYGLTIVILLFVFWKISQEA